MSNGANITVYALTPPAVTCSITSGADGRPTACVPVRRSIDLTAVPSASGTYQWSTTSTKIFLDKVTKQTVTVWARNSVSASSGPETVQLVFTPTGGAALAPVTRKVTVISVAFSQSATQNYGYDDMDNVANEPHHVSVKSPGFTTVHVKVDGGGTVDDLEFLSDDITIAEPVLPAAASGELTIEGKNQIKAETSIKAKCKGGPVCVVLKANVYGTKAVTATVAKVHDSRVPATRLLRSNFDVVAAANQINNSYKSLVATLTLKDARLAGDAMDIPFDDNGDGALAIEPGSNTSAEFQKIIDSIPTTDRLVVIVKEVSLIYYLSVPAKQNDKTITLRPEYGDALNSIFIDPLQSIAYSLGSGTQADSVILTKQHSDAPNVFDLKSGLLNDHPILDGIRFPIGGVSAQSGRPTLVQENTDIDKQIWAIGHELGHTLLKLRDLDAATNLMNFDETSQTDQKLRFKDLPLHYTDETHETQENQWNKIER